jgi:hypothetical protein
LAGVGSSSAVRPRSRSCSAGQGRLSRSMTTGYGLSRVG